MTLEGKPSFKFIHPHNRYLFDTSWMPSLVLGAGICLYVGQSPCSQGQCRFVLTCLCLGPLHVYAWIPRGSHRARTLHACCIHIYLSIQYLRVHTESRSASLQVDEQLYRLQFERADLLKRIDEDQDDLNGLMQKHKDLIAQVRTSPSL